MRLDFETWCMNRCDLDEVQCMKIFYLDPNLLSQGENVLKYKKKVQRRGDVIFVQKTIPTSFFHDY